MAFTDLHCAIWKLEGLELGTCVIATCLILAWQKDPIACMFSNKRWFQKLFCSHLAKKLAVASRYLVYFGCIPCPVHPSPQLSQLQDGVAHLLRWELRNVPERLASSFRMLTPRRLKDLGQTMGYRQLWIYMFYRFRSRYLQLNWKVYRSCIIHALSIYIYIHKYAVLNLQIDLSSLGGW